MLKRVICLILFVIFIILFMSNIVYVEILIKFELYGFKVLELKNKEDIFNSFEEIKMIRGNLIVINIKFNMLFEDLKIIDNNLEGYIE